MITLKVAWGITNAENAQAEDPTAEKDLITFEKEPMYSTYTFETQAEADAFKLAVDEADGWYTAYIVQK